MEHSQRETPAKLTGGVQGVQLSLELLHVGAGNLPASSTRHKQQTHQILQGFFSKMP